MGESPTAKKQRRINPVLCDAFPQLPGQVVPVAALPDDLESPGAGGMVRALELEIGGWENEPTGVYVRHGKWIDDLTDPN